MAVRNCSAAQRITLEQIKEACDHLASVNGRISQANVAREIERTHGRRVYQTIRNVDVYRTYIKQRGIDGAYKANSSKTATAAKILSTDPVAAVQIEFLEVQLQNALNYIQRLERGIRQLSPVSGPDFSNLLEAIDGHGSQGNTSQAEKVSQPPPTNVSPEVRGALARLMQRDFLAKFQLRLDHGEIVNKLELTLLDRAAVRFLAQLTNSDIGRDN